MNPTTFDRQPLYSAIRPLDTDAEAWRVQCGIWRHMPAEEKLRIVFELSENVREMAVAGAQQRLPHATAHEIQSAVALQMLGRELWLAAYGHPDCSGETA